MSDLFSIEGKVAVVTGGSRGIGEMIARGLLDAGARVYICSRKEEELSAASSRLSEYGEVEALAVDLSTPEGIEDLMGLVGEREEGVDALFNNAGANWGAPLEEFPESGFDKVLDLNVKSVFLLTQAMLPLLRAASSPGDPSRVINIGSIDGLRVPVKGMNNFSYSASKAAVHMLTHSMAGELAPEVLVNAIAPGLFESKMTKTLLTAGAEEVGSHLPLGRIGNASDIAGISIYLTSRASAYVTGAVIPVDGGVSNR